MKNLIIFIFIAILSGCNSHNIKTEDKRVARVLDNYLYMSDLSEVIPSGLSANDSIAMAKEFIDKWIRNQLILNKAELNLTEKEKDVKQKIESYRSSLLIYTYEQRYINEKLDTIITDNEIEDYFKTNTSNFVLNSTLIKGAFIEVPANAPEIYKVRQWCHTYDDESIKNLAGYCFQHAFRYDHFDNSWVDFNEVLQLLPSRINNPENYLEAKRLLETRDSTNYYFIPVSEYVLNGSTSPLELVKEDIRSIILNKRKIKLVNELESNIYDDAQNRGNFTIF